MLGHVDRRLVEMNEDGVKRAGHFVEQSVASYAVYVNDAQVVGICAKIGHNLQVHGAVEETAALGRVLVLFERRDEHSVEQLRLAFACRFDCLN